jgi:hypothetical protein
MDCKTARLLLDFARPLCPELDTADAEALHSHLAECPECGPFAAGERRIDGHFGRAVRDVPVPEDFKQRLLNRLSRERDAWYRRWIVRGGAAAAAVLLAVVGMWYFWPLPRPNVEQIQNAMSDKGVATEETVADYFQKQRLYLGALSRFNFAKLRDYYVEEFEGRRVPALVFRGEEGDPPTRVFAKVLVLSARQFNVTDLRERPKAESGSPKVEVLDLDDPNVIFVVIHDANDLRPFLLRGREG